MRRWGQGLKRRWALPVAALLVGLAHLLRLAALPDLGPSHVFLTFYPAVILAALIGGGRGGLAATLLSAVVADYFWIAPIRSFGFFERADGLSMLAFLACGGLISMLAMRLGRIQERLRAREANEREALQAKVAAISADLTRNQRRFTAALLNSRVSVWEQDVDLRYSWIWNPRLGYDLEQVIGKSDADLMDRACLDDIETFKRRVIATGRGEQREIAVAAPGAPLDWFDLYAETIRDDAGAVVGLTCVAVQITERVALERELRSVTTSLEARVQSEVAARQGAQQRAAQAERMQALGRLAGGIAHDLNNVLQAVSGGATLIHRRAADPAEVRMLADRVLDAVERGAATTRRLLAFSRGGDLNAESLDMASLLVDVAAILDHAIGSNIRVKIEAPPCLPPLLADKAQLETVLLNLATNARDAMIDGGVLTIAADIDAAREDSVRLRVIDNGAGMDEATLTRATEPLFTTKPHGRGTGLGLSMARAFAEQSGGVLRLDSRAGAGTTVSLWLPRAPETTDAARGPSTPTPRIALTARVLLVDDEAFVRETLGEELRLAGFTVDQAESADDALVLLAGGCDIDVLVSDLSMPGQADGLALIGEARRRNPVLPAILLTGHLGPEAEASLDLATRGGVSLLRKPTSGAELARHIGELLAQKSRGL